MLNKVGNGVLWSVKSVRRAGSFIALDLVLFFMRLLTPHFLPLTPYPLLLTIPDVSKVPAERQETDEKEGPSIFERKGVVRSALAGNSLKFSWLRALASVPLRRTLEWHKGC